MTNIRRIVFSTVCIGYGLFLSIKGEAILANVWLATAVTIAQIIE